MSSPPRALRATLERLARGQVTSLELVEYALSVPDIYGAIERRLLAARVEAQASDERRAQGKTLSPLDGLPFGVKANIDVQGVTTTAGTALSRPPAAADAVVVAVLRSAGAIPAITTTLAEAAVGAVTDNPHTGVCRNPRDPRLHAGGSSGGSAAVVAGGVVPFALGSDTMGSTRIPASYCGVVALKPSRNGLSNTGLAPLCHSLDTVGLIVPTPGDLEIVLGQLMPGTCATGPSSPTIAVPGFARQVDAGGLEALERGVRAVESLGAFIQMDFSLSIEPDVVRRRGLLLCEVEGFEEFRDELENGDPGLSSGLVSFLRYGANQDVLKVDCARSYLEQVEMVVSAAFKDVDAFLLPITPGPIPLVGADPVDAANLSAWVNVAGLPSAVFPTGDWEDTEARGLQLVGPHGSDKWIATLAASLATFFVPNRD